MFFFEQNMQKLTFLLELSLFWYILLTSSHSNHIQISQADHIQINYTILNRLYISRQNASQLGCQPISLARSTDTLSESARKTPRSLPKYITIYSNNYLNSASQLQLSEKCKQSCAIQLYVFHFFSFPPLFLQPFTAQ